MDVASCFEPLFLHLPTYEIYILKWQQMAQTFEKLLEENKELSEQFKAKGLSIMEFSDLSGSPIQARVFSSETFSLKV